MKLLESYAQGEWFAGLESPIILNSAITGESVAQIKNGSIDASGMLNYARTEGGHALRKLTFHQRAIKLKEMALFLLQHKKEFYALSAHTGATYIDSWIDIEGGIQTLFSYSGTGRRELPNAKFIVDGASEVLSKNATFVGQHIRTPLEGVAMHINAFNFPCWGMLEKLAVSLLSGVPSIIKPASCTAYVAEAMFRRMIESGIFPEGSLQLISGDVGDIFEYFDYQDVVTFTGSAKVGQMLKNKPTIQSRSVRFIMEADSLNCSVLGVDAVPGSPEFELYVKQIVTEISTKCGQRCTGIRRAIVPENLLEPVTSALHIELNKLIIGDPANRSVTMGALVSQQQRNDVRSSVEKLRQDAEVVYGDPQYCEALDADGERGAFMSPIVLSCERPFASQVVHNVEAFGPVSTLMPYSNIDEMLELARLGRGSLVASVVTHDADFAREAVVGLAPHHGRILLLDRDCAEDSTGHGSPLPRLVHGGPGRAGGGEEMGGIRGVGHYLQTTALQGSPNQLSAVTNQWILGANREEDGIHPFRKTFEELVIGNSYISDLKEIKLDDIEHFAEFTGDKFYAHMDEEAAKANPFFEGRVAHGYYIVSLAAGLFVEPNPGPVLANYGVDNLRFLQPVYVGDSLRVALSCKQKTDRINEVYGEVRWDAEVSNQNDEVVAHYDVLTLVANGQG